MRKAPGGRYTGVAWPAAGRRGRAAIGRYLGAAGTGGLGLRGIWARPDAGGAEVRGRYGPEVAWLAIRGRLRHLLGRVLYRLFGVVAFASLAIDATIGGGAATVCVGGGIAVCVAGIVVTLMSSADSKAAAASAIPGRAGPRRASARLASDTCAGASSRAGKRARSAGRAGTR